MFSEHKKKQDDLKKDRNGEIIFDELEAKTGKLKISEEGKKEKIYTSSDEINRVQKKRSIKKADKRDSTVSLNLTKNSENQSAASSNRSNSIESSNVTPNMGFGIFEAASMMCNIVDITTDSTNNKKNATKPLKSFDSKTSLTGSGPFAQLKEAQEMKKKSKASFDEGESDE